MPGFGARGGKDEQSDVGHVNFEVARCDINLGIIGDLT